MNLFPSFSRLRWVLSSSSFSQPEIDFVEWEGKRVCCVKTTSKKHDSKRKDEGQHKKELRFVSSSNGKNMQREEQHRGHRCKQTIFSLPFYSTLFIPFCCPKCKNRPCVQFCVFNFFEVNREERNRGQEQGRRVERRVKKKSKAQEE